ncbi:MAG: glycosyltransferase [Candidatus Aenigmarchaeota archaeon]|nr:glycosyltransferase [Candidatus Aenigmarchaeota archaeon]
MKVSVLIPTKNEPLINELIEEVHEVLKGYEHEVIVIDKSDVSPEIKNAKLVVQKSDGLGKAILEGLPHVTGDVIVTMDADFSHDPKDLPKLIEEIDGHDIVIGSRFVPGGRNEDKMYRRFVSFLFTKIASFILNLRVEDSMSGFAVIKRNVYEKLKLNPIGFKINTEILYKGKKLGFKTTEVPIMFRKRKAGKTKVGVSFSGLKEGFRILRYVFELKLGLR